MKKLLWAILIIVAVVVAVGVTMLNPDPMIVDLGGVLPALGKGRRLKKAQKKLLSSEKELESLRQSSAPEKS